MAYKFTDENVYEVIASGHPVVIDFWAEWCGPCKALAPTIDKLAEEFADQVVIGKYNTDGDNTEFCTEHRIMSIPTILFFKNGEQVRDLRISGKDEKKLRENIEKLLVL